MSNVYMSNELYNGTLHDKRNSELFDLKYICITYTTFPESIDDTKWMDNLPNYNYLQLILLSFY